MTTTDPNAKAPTPDAPQIPTTVPSSVSGAFVEMLNHALAENTTQHAKIAALEAKLEVVEKQRDKAQKRLQRLDEGLRELGYESAQDVVNDVLGALFAAIEGWNEARERSDDYVKRLNKLHGAVAGVGAIVVVADDTHEQIVEEIVRAASAEARKRLDALVAEVERTAGQLHTTASLVEYAVSLTKTEIANGIRDVALGLRQAIATMAPQAAPARVVFSPEATVWLQQAHELVPFEVTGIESFDEDGGIIRVTLEQRGTAILAAPSEPGNDDKPAAAPPCGHRSGIHDEYCDVINEPELPPVGEGAALIADTEQEIADDLGGEDPQGTEQLIGQRDAWEETARILARALDERPAAVGAATEEHAETELDETLREAADALLMAANHVSLARALLASPTSSANGGIDG